MICAGAVTFFFPLEMVTKAVGCGGYSVQLGRAGVSKVAPPCEFAHWGVFHGHRINLSPWPAASQVHVVD